MSAQITPKLAAFGASRLLPRLAPHVKWRAASRAGEFGVLPRLASSMRVAFCAIVMVAGSRICPLRTENSALKAGPYSSGVPGM